MYNSNYISDAMLDHMAEEYYLNNPCVGSAEYYEKHAREEEERERYEEWYAKYGEDMHDDDWMFEPGGPCYTAED